jgi:hypothetical protein
MQIVPLEFNPRKPWPATLPALAWAGVPFAGVSVDPEGAKAGALVEMSQRTENFAEAFVTAYPVLGLGELARLFSAVQTHPSRELLNVSWAELFARYGYRDGETFRQALILLKNAPVEFVDWVDEKGLGIRDLAPLRAPTDAAFLACLLIYVGTSRPPKSIGVQIIEWAVDLHLMEQSLDFSLTFEKLHAQAKAARFSRRSEARTQLTEKIKKISWPKEVQAVVSEKGDRLGFEVRIFSESAEDFARKVEQLSLSVRQLTTGTTDGGAHHLAHLESKFK